MKAQSVFSPQLKSLQRQLAAWRRRARPRQALPEPLWQAAAALAQRWGLSPVSRGLRLNYTALKRRLPGPGPEPAVAAPSPAFVEVAWPSGCPTAQGRLVWEHPRGGKMTLEWTGADIVPLLSLAQTFWHRRA